MHPEPAAQPSRAAVTSTTLLEGLRDPDNRTVWRHYVERYRPLLVRYARKLGATGEEAEDLAQATLLAFSTAYRAGRYDRDRGRLSSWLFGIARNEVRAWGRARQKRRLQAGTTEGEERIADLEADDALQELWEAEWRDALLRECLRLLRRELQPQTLAAFERFALEERTAEEVARELGTSTSMVFSAKHRVLQRIRELMPLVEDTW